MEKLIVLADLGRIRILELRRGGRTPQEQDHLFKRSEEALEPRPQSRGALVTDAAGRFGQGQAVGREGGMSHGDQHNLDTELERRAIERLAKRIGELVADADYPLWALAAPKAILKSLQKQLPKACRASLAETVPLDLTKETHAKLEERFV